MSDEDTTVLLSTDRISVETEEITEPKQETYQNTAQTINLKETQNFLSSIATVMSGLIFGYELGMAANLIKPMSSVFNLSCSEHFYVVTWWLFGVLLAAALGGYIIDTLGRRCSIVISMFILFMNTIVSILVTYTGVRTLPHLYLKSRFILGFAGPLSAIAQHVYISETSEPENRGFRIGLHQFGFAFGSLIAFIPLFFMDTHSEWRAALTQLIGFQSVLVITITLFWLPPSPNDVMQLKPEKTKNKKTRSYKIEVLLETIGLGMFLVEVQQLCGRYTVLYYSPRLLSLVGVCANDASKLAITLYAIIKFVASGLCLLIVDRMGRRMSLIMSSTIMMTCLSLLALLASIDDPDLSPSFYYPENCENSPQSDPSYVSWRPDDPDEPYALPKSKSPPPYPMLPTPLSLVSSQSDICPEEVSNLSPALRVIGIITVIVYQVADVLGYGTVTWIILSEIFPTTVRGRCACAITMIYWMDVGSPSMFTQLGSSIGSTFLIYSFICMGAIIVTYVFIPETKNKTLEEIGQNLRDISLIPRFYENLNSLPLIGNSLWLKRQMQNLPTHGSTDI